MKTITLAKAHEILSNADHIILTDQGEVVNGRWGFAELTGDPENEWFAFFWEDLDGNEYVAKFSEDGNETVKVDGDKIYLNDDMGDDCTFQVLYVQDIENMVD
jgi:hypothetical protein